MMLMRWARKGLGLIGLGVMVMRVNGSICDFVLVCVCGKARRMPEANYTVL